MNKEPKLSAQLGKFLDDLSLFSPQFVNLVYTRQFVM
jgi:hypothetical protein